MPERFLTCSKRFNIQSEGFISEPFMYEWFHLMEKIYIKNIVVKCRKISKSHMTLTLTKQWPISNSFELFSYTTICSSFKWIEPLFFELSCTQTDTQTDRQTYGHEYSIVAVYKP